MTTQSLLYLRDRYGSPTRMAHRRANLDAAVQTFRVQQQHQAAIRRSDPSANPCRCWRTVIARAAAAHRLPRAWPSRQQSNKISLLCCRCWTRGARRPASALACGRSRTNCVMLDECFPRRRCHEFRLGKWQLRYAGRSSSPRARDPSSHPRSAKCRNGCTQWPCTPSSCNGNRFGRPTHPLWPLDRARGCTSRSCLKQGGRTCGRPCSEASLLAGPQQEAQTPSRKR